MNENEIIYFPKDEPDYFEKLMIDFTNQININPYQVNQIINYIFSIDRNEVLHYQKFFISFLANPPQLSNEILASSEILTLVAIALSSFQILYLDKPIHDSFIQSWTKFMENNEIDVNIIFKLSIIFRHLISINDIPEKQLIELASTLIHFLELDCFSNKLTNSLISYILDTLNFFFQKISNPELTRRVISVCNQYIHITFQPIKMIIAANFLIQNYDQYNECLQHITQSLQNFKLFHEDSLYKAFSSISKKLNHNLKSCSPWSIYDAFSIVTSFSTSNLHNQITEQQVNAILALNFFGVEKKINNEMDYFNSAINFLANEKEEVPLLQLCDSFRFSPIISIRNYQIFTIFFIYSIKIETFLLKLDDESNSDSQILDLIESFGRNFEYFKTIVDSIIFFNHEIKNGMFASLIELKKPIVNQFIKTMILFFKFIIKFTSKYEYPKDECTEYDDDCYVLLDKFSSQCKKIVIIRKAWEIVNYTSRRIFEFLGIFPTNLLSVLYSKYVDQLLSEKASQLYVFVIVSFFTNMKVFQNFLNALFKNTLMKIEDREFVKNAVIFLKWSNQLLSKNPIKVICEDWFINSTKNFFIQFFRFTFSTAYTISLHSSLIQNLIKLIKKLFDEKYLLKIIPADVVIQLYFAVPSSNKENKHLCLFLFQLYQSHKAVLMKFEWYQRLLLKYAILKPKFAINAIKENNMIYDYKNTPEFKKFATDLLTIFDSYSSNELRKTVLEMISYIPAKYTTCPVQPVVDISHYCVTAIVSNEKLLVINGRQLLNYIREIITCSKPDNPFEDFVNFVNYHSIDNDDNGSQPISIEKDLSNSDGLFGIFNFLGFLANSVIEKCETLDHFLFIQDVFTLIIQFSKDVSHCLPSSLSPSYVAHFIVSLAINSKYFDLNLGITDSPEYFSSVLSEVENVLFNVSYPCYRHATFVGKYLIEHFSKSSINILQMTKYVLNFILRQLDSQLIPSHHVDTDDGVKFDICHFLPEEVFEIVLFLKENVNNCEAIDFIPLFEVKLPFIASFSLCEIISNSQLNGIDDKKEKDFFDDEEKKSLSDYLNDFAEIDLQQIVPLLLLFPSHQEKFLDLCSESIKISMPKSKPNPSKIPFVFCLLGLPQSSFKLSLDVLKTSFINSSPADSVVIAECIKKAHSVLRLESKKKSPLSVFVRQVLSNNGFHDDFFVSDDLASFKHLFSLFVLQPSLVITVITDQLNLLIEKKYKDSQLIESNIQFLLDFLTLPAVIGHLVKNNEYKKIGKLFLKIYFTFSLNVADLMISYFSVKPKIWSNFLVKNITKEEYLFFFFENIQAEKLSQIVIDIKENTQVLSDHLQIEYIQFFAIENSDIPYNQIKEAFLSYFTQKDRHFLQDLIAYLVDNGEIWDLILSFLKSNKNYLLQCLKLEIMKNDNHDFESLPDFLSKISIEYFSSFFEFFFECYRESVDIELLQNIITNIECNRIPLFERVLSKYSFNFEFDFDQLLQNRKSENDLSIEKEPLELIEFGNNLLNLHSHDSQKIHSILESVDIDTPSYVFEEIEKVVLDENCELIRSLMMRFVKQRKHFLSILKLIQNNRSTFSEDIFELFSNELVLFASLNLFKTTEKNVVFNIDCFNVLCSFLSQSNQCNASHLLWGKKLSEIANLILPVFVKDDTFFHKNYSEFSDNLVLLVSLFGSQCKFIKTYFGIISKFYYENDSLILHELFECVPKIIQNLENLNPSELNPFVSLLCEMVNVNKNLTFPYALHALNLLTQKGFGNIKKITGPLSLIVKGELNEIPFSKLNFNFDYSFLNSLKNVFCRWFLNPLNTEAFSKVIEKVDTKSDLSNWLLFSRSQISNDFNVDFKSDSEYDHFFNNMPFQIIEKHRNLIVNDSSVPLYYYKLLSFCPKVKKKDKNKDNMSKFKSFFKLFSIDYYYRHILANTEHRMIVLKGVTDQESIESLNLSKSGNISFFSGVSACLYPPDFTSKINVNKSPSSSFQLLQDARGIIGIPKSYPNQIIERLNRAKDLAFQSLKSSEIVQFLCVCSLCHNPIVPPYFSRYHSIKLFEDFNRILQFATTKGINVDFSPLDKSESFITQSQCDVNSSEKVTTVKTKENFLIYAMKNQFNNPRIWSDMSAIENDDILYLFLHSNILPSNAKIEVLKQIKEFPFRWCQILFNDIKKGDLNESFISLVSDVFRIDYSSVFSCVTKLEEVSKLRTKSFFESRIMEDEHPSHNFTFVVNPTKQFFSTLPICAPLLPNGPMSPYSYPMHCVYLSIDKENSSFGTVEVCLADGTRVKYLLTAMIGTFCPELNILSHMINKILMKRVYCRSKNVELFSPQIQLITSENEVKNDSKLFLVRTNALPILRYSIYDHLLKVKREGKFPDLKNFNQFTEFKSSKDFYNWETAFLHRFAAFSYLQVGLAMKVVLPFHLLVDESVASLEFLQLRKQTVINDINNGDGFGGSKLRVFGEMIKFISPKIALAVLPTAMVNIATAFKFNDERLSVILNNLIGIGFSEKMERFNKSLQSKDGTKIVENLISSSCNDISISDIPWF
ncbi:hypothetical protein M9Y10_033979 [Tritrichomonas musculus]|uniref:Non-specific serine/threonine protein kinase n=1 Tax=Tritrichomonas musculus TaxID=1915356 RepID=A0ABR2KEF8_9EUKA